MVDKVKRGRLSKVEEFYIHNNMKDKSVQDIATDLGRSVAVVTKYAEGKKSDPTNAPNTEESTPTEAPVDKHSMEGIAQAYKGVNMKEAMQRARIKSKGKKTGVVMTEEMSGKADTARGNPGPNRMTGNAIFKPFGDDLE